MVRGLDRATTRVIARVTLFATTVFGFGMVIVALSGGYSGKVASLLGLAGGVTFGVMFTSATLPRWRSRTLVLPVPANPNAFVADLTARLRAMAYEAEFHHGSTHVFGPRASLGVFSERIVVSLSSDRVQVLGPEGPLRALATGLSDCQ